MTLIKSISGIRGTIGGGAGQGLNPLDIVKFTSAYATLIRQTTTVKSNKIVVGRDARISGEMVNNVVCGTLMGMGFDVVNIGLASTPTTELAVTMEGACGGIILTASHNPKQWNALKLLNEHGEFLNAEEGNEVLRIAEAEAFEYADVDHLGSYREDFTYNQKHIDSVLSLKLVDVEAIRNRANQIRNQITLTTSEYDREKLQERLAKMAGGVAVIKAGAATETEMKEKKLRIEDALNATRAAVEEGIVAGGGTVYVNAIPAVLALLDTVEGDEKTGVKIVAKALEEPVRQIATNAGIDGSVVLENVKKSEDGVGFDAYKEEYCDMITAGIVDPAKVTRSALQNAASVSAMVLTTESLVAEKPEPPAPLPAGMDGMGGMGF